MILSSRTEDRLKEYHSARLGRNRGSEKRDAPLFRGYARFIYGKIPLVAILSRSVVYFECMGRGQLMISGVLTRKAMNKRSLLFLIVLILAMILSTFALAMGAQPQDAAAKKADPKEETKRCLACHGPFDELVASTAGYIAPSEEKITPHKYVPHDDPTEANINNCTNCHTPHPVPLESKESVVKPNVDWCYTNCHHAYNFSPCSQCH
jgi:hypothetical protein